MKIDFVFYSCGCIYDGMFRGSFFALFGINHREFLAPQCLLRMGFSFISKVGLNTIHSSGVMALTIFSPSPNRR
jgi:hypothetical protein